MPRQTSNQLNHIAHTDLDERGVFALMRTIQQVAEHLKVSRANASNYLDEIRGNPASDNET